MTDTTDMRRDEPSDQLLELEATIERGLETFYEVGMALRTIRNEGLWRERDCHTFEVYLQMRWHPRISRAYANYLIDAARTQTALLERGVTDVTLLPVTEGAMRPLAELMPIDPEKPVGQGQRTDLGRPPTTAEVERVMELVKADSRVDEKHPPTDKVIAEHVKTVRLEMRLPTAEDKKPGKPTNPYVKAGDLYAVGPHRVVAGDSTDPGVLRRALGDLVPNLLLTDPPYGVDIVGRTEEELTIENDGPESTVVPDVFRALEGILPSGMPYYVCSPAGDREYAMRDAVLLLGPLSQSIVWKKDRMVLGRQHYHYIHELLMYGWVGSARPPWYGGRDKITFWEIARPGANRQHPTMKPLELMAEPIHNSTRENDVVFDPFAGSGSTLVAAAQLGRIGVGVELDPAYAQVVITRLENELHEKAELLTS